MTTFDNANNIDLSPYANANFQLRFVYDDGGDYSFGVAVDDVVITTGTLSTSDVASRNKNIQMYPNPVKDFLYLKAEDNDITTLTVTDMSGKKVKYFQGKSQKYDFADLPSGTYIVMVDSEGKITRKKIVKK